MITAELTGFIDLKEMTVSWCQLSSVLCDRRMSVLVYGGRLEPKGQPQKPLHHTERGPGRTLPWATVVLMSPRGSPGQTGLTLATHN